MFSIVTIQILFLFFPGILGVKLIEFLENPKEKLSKERLFVDSFILGTVCYTITAFFFEKNSFIVGLKTQKLFLNNSEIITASILSICLCCVYLKYKQIDFWHRISQKSGLTNSSAHNTVLETMYNSSEYTSLRKSWVNVRYHNSNECFLAIVDRYNIENNTIELLLKDVSVYYDNKTKPSYEMKYIYIKTNPEKIYIEYFK